MTTKLTFTHPRTQKSITLVCKSDVTAKTNQEIDLEDDNWKAKCLFIENAKKGDKMFTMMTKFFENMKSKDFALTAFLDNGEDYLPVFAMLTAKR